MAVVFISSAAFWAGSFAHIRRPADHGRSDALLFTSVSHLPKLSGEGPQTTREALLLGGSLITQLRLPFTDELLRLPLSLPSGALHFLLGGFSDLLRPLLAVSVTRPASLRAVAATSPASCFATSFISLCPPPREDPVPEEGGPPSRPRG